MSPDVDGLRDRRPDSATSLADYNTGAVKPDRAAEVCALELARELVDETELTPDALEINADALEEGNYSVRVVTTGRTLQADALEAIGSRGYPIEYLGERTTRPRTSVWLIETDGDANRRVY